MMFSRGSFTASLLATLALPALRAEAAAPVFYTSPGCGCCHAWTDRMAAAGMPVSLVDSENLAGESAKLGIPQGLEGCHVGEIDGYAISGHVPPEDIKRLLTEKPDARGLLVPGMPVGSPGMEMDGQTERFDVLLLGRDGKTSVFASHG
jgi:hypothetical protein